MEVGAACVIATDKQTRAATLLPGQQRRLGGAAGSISSVEDQPFRMTIEDLFEITGRGLVVGGRIERGVVRIGDSLQVVTFNGPTRNVRVRGIEFACPPFDRDKPRDPNQI